MEDYKILYKSQSISLSPTNHSKRNREQQRVARSKKREECFQSNRKMDVSPTPIKEIPEKVEMDEPAKQNAEQENENPNETSKLSKKETYLQRYIKWKAENRQRAPPRNTKNPANEVATFVPPKRRSLYVVIDHKTQKTTEIKLPSAPLKPSNLQTQPAPVIANRAQPVKTTIPPKRNLPPAAPTLVKAAPMGRSTPATKPPPAPTAAKPQTAAARATVAAKKVLPLTTAAKPATTAVKPKPAAPIRKPFTAVKNTLGKPQHLATAFSNPVKPQPTVVSNAVKPQATVGINPVKPQPAVALSVRPTNLMTQPFDKPVVAATAKIVKPIRTGGGGAASKFKPAAAQKPAKSQAAANLSTRMKVKKVVPAKTKQTLTKRLPDLKKELLDIAKEEVLPDTPLELVSAENPFHAQATSTQNRTNNSSQNLLEAYRDITNLSPVTAVDKCNKSTVTSAKRQLLPMEAEEQAKRRFNFVRYSEAHSLLESPTAEEEAPEKETLMPAETESQTVVQQTPPQDATNKPNYLSPFVSVSRGKVNSQTERRKRNSMYLQDDHANQQEHQQPETPVAVRRTLQSVQYFRIQLENEIQRLHALCDEWHGYVEQHADMLAETGGKDMIDATIGQTKLLTSKKLMQFKSLIDRCEACATGVGLAENDGSEATKPVLAEDLEGWWDMMRLQGDNVDNRFANLTRWKANNWLDPDAVAQPKPKAKVAKAKTKPVGKMSSQLKNFLRKAYAEKRKHQVATDNPVEEISQSNNSSSSRVIVVRDRKSFSPARTVLRMSLGSGGRATNASKELLKSAIKAAAEQITRPQATPPGATPRRMSILKTPGTKRRDTIGRGVMFSAKKNVRRFQFTVEEGNTSTDDEKALGVEKLEDCEEDMSMERSSSSLATQAAVQMPTETTTATPQNMLRTCVLRNRRVNIRHSSEFMF